MIPARFERATDCLEGSCSIQLSYGTLFAVISVVTKQRTAAMGGKIKPKALFVLKKIHFICSILLMVRFICSDSSVAET